MFGGKEPTVVFNGLAQLVSLIIPALILFDLIHWSADQVAGFMAVVTFAAGFIATLLTRQTVVPTEVANKQIETALKLPSTSTVSEVVAKSADK